MACWLLLPYLVTIVTCSLPRPFSRNSAAKALVVAEVSMTKITRRPYQPAVAAKVFELDESGVLDGQTLAQLAHHSSRIKYPLKARVRQPIPFLHLAPLPSAPRAHPLPHPH